MLSVVAAACLLSLELSPQTRYEKLKCFTLKCGLGTAKQAQNQEIICFFFCKKTHKYQTREYREKKSFSCSFDYLFFFCCDRNESMTKIEMQNTKSNRRLR